MKAKNYWVPHYECPICGESSSTPEPTCPFCGEKLYSPATANDPAPPITLSRALKLCDIRDEMIDIRTADSREVSIWDGKLRNKFDPKKIRVHKITPTFSYDGYEGLRFKVTGVTWKELIDAGGILIR
jgi:hypothetical protein